ncbi:MAG: hypothetical protein K2M91_05695 [Lachnospiraceae bacterium]|nr:hypothetical protein [Lachnospiraceae bacterium]
MNEFLTNVVEVRTVHYDEQVNKLLSEGWKLIHVGTSSHLTYEYGADPGFESETDFILALFQ